MIRLEFTSDQIKTLQHQAYSHPHPFVQRKMHALLMKSADIPHNKITKSIGISENTLRSYFIQYQHGDIEELKRINFYKPKSLLYQHQSTIEDHFRQNPQYSIKEAAHTIKKLTGIKRGLTQTQAFMKSVGLKRLKTGGKPAKSDHVKQTEFHNNVLQPKLDEAKQGARAVYFIDAAHFVHSLFLAFVWCFSRVFVQSPSGRSRFNVLGAINAITHQLITVTNTSYINANSVCELLHKLAKLHANTPITLILDNARYQKCVIVTALAQQLNIELLYLPSYSPNLNLIERLWKFVKKKCLNGRYYATFAEFTVAITNCLESLPEYEDELKTLLNLKFQDLSGNHFGRKTVNNNNTDSNGALY